jgi:hypothetical protein
MTPEQMKELAARIDNLALGFGDINEATDLIRQMAESPAPQPARVPTEAIGKLLAQMMDVAVANGANSVSMPDEYVEVAAWLHGIRSEE